MFGMQSSDSWVILGSRNFKSLPVSLHWLNINQHVLHRDNFHSENWLLNTKSDRLRCELTLYLFLFFRSKQSLFLYFDRVRNKMERSQVNNNSNFIIIYSIKYLQAQKNLCNLFTKPELYLSETNVSILNSLSIFSYQCILFTYQCILFTEVF